MTTPITSTQDLHVQAMSPLTPPIVLREQLPLTERAAQTVLKGREAIRRVLDGRDERLLVIVGPCSIHDETAALEYADRLADLARRVEETLLVVMRVYFEKPRTTVGWKGLINDPHLDDSFDMQTGLRIARRLLVAINEKGVPAATELLEPITPQYLADLIAWTAIGARTTESPTHRQMASGLSMPVGFKNGTDGDCQTAIDALISARAPHAFLGIDAEGRTCVVQTRGNPWGHLILRGGRGGPNHSPEQLADAVARLNAANLPARVMIDCSHANSNKNPAEQGRVFRSVLKRTLEEPPPERHLLGLMLESHLFPGNQPLTSNRAALRYGVSITDGCIGWDETESLLLQAHQEWRAHLRSHYTAAFTSA
jgi:3-deoxy-7-phosphoheptulonate synthase